MTLICANNAAWMAKVERRIRGKVTLCYADPPFGTGVEQQGSRGTYQDPAVRPENWVQGQRGLLARCWDALTLWGCLVVHCDQRMSHHLKVAMDGWFGREHFTSEIVWRYRRWPTKTRNFQRMHDVLLRYVRSPGKQRWHQLYDALAPSTQETWGDRRQRAVFDGRGRRLHSLATREASEGAPMSDVWDIGVIAPMAHERTGYPTQKPEALLERLVLACTDPGDLVFDPYVGSGTSVVVATRLGRRAIGVDCNPQAIEVATERLRKLAESGPMGHVT